MSITCEDAETVYAYIYFVSYLENVCLQCMQPAPRSPLSFRIRIVYGKIQNQPPKFLKNTKKEEFNYVRTGYGVYIVICLVKKK